MALGKQRKLALAPGALALGKSLVIRNLMD